MDTDVLVRDYLGRLTSAAAALPAHRRGELVGEVRDHIDAALAEAGRSDEVTVRNILERLGAPEEIVAGEAGHAGAPGSAVASTRTGWGAVEVAALLLLGLAWPALFIPFVGWFLWPAFGFIGLVLTWASRLWSTRKKVVASVIVVALYGLFFLATFPVVRTTPSPVVTTNP